MAEEDKSKAICFVLRYDENRYKKLLDDLESSSYRDRDE